MLEVARVCPRCGQRLPDSPTASTYHLTGRGCRPTVFAALPEMEPSVEGEEDVPPVPAGRRIHDFEVHSAFAGDGELAQAAAEPAPNPASLSRAIAAPWLRPPDLGEVL